MMESKDKTENELRNEIKQIEDEREEMEQTVRRLQSQEEVYDQRMHIQFARLEELSSICAAEYAEELAHIDECQHILNAQRSARVEFQDNLKAFRRKKNKEFEIREEDIHQQMHRLGENL